MSVDKLPAFENFPPGKGQHRIVLWIKGMYRSISRKINFLLSLVNIGFMEIPVDDQMPGADGNWRWRVDGADLVLQRLTSGTWTDTAIKMFSTGEFAILSPSQNWKLSATQSAGAMGLQSQAIATQGRLQLFTKDGDGTDNFFIDIFGQGTPADISTSHSLAVGYAAGAFQDYILSSSKSIRLRSGGSSVQVKLNTDGTMRLGDTAGADYTKISATGDIMPVGSAFIVLQKASGNGIKVDQTTPTFGWHDLQGDILIKVVGANDPDYSDYAATGIYRHQFKNTAMTQVFNSYHIPHDYVPGSDVFMHIHWSQTTIDTGGAAGAPGNAKWYFDANYSKGHDRGAFPAAVVTVSVVQAASGTIRQHLIAEVQLSTSGQIGGQDLEPDGIVTVRSYRDAGDAADTLDQRPWVHHADVHYQSTNIPTKQKEPDFYT